MKLLKISIYNKKDNYFYNNKNAIKLIKIKNFLFKINY